jgi:hypothetical protein
MNDDYTTSILLDLLNKRYSSAIWNEDTIRGMSTQNIYDALTHIERREKNMYSYNKQRDIPRDVAQALLGALEAGISLDELLKANKTVKVWYNQLIADRDKAKIARQREVARQAKLDEKKRQEDEARAAAATKLTPEELAAFGLDKKGAKKW